VLAGRQAAEAGIPDPPHLVIATGLNDTARTPQVECRATVLVVLVIGNEGLDEFHATCSATASTG